MKVLYVSSGNAKFGISQIVKNQGDSLIINGIDISYFPIKGKGILGYLKAINPLRKELMKNNYDVVHSHYSLSGFVTTIAAMNTKIPHIVSLMGSDVSANHFWKLIIKICSKFYWKKTIVKSIDMFNKIKLKSMNIIPNGVYLELFDEINKKEAQKEVGFMPEKFNIIWVSNPARKEKNFELARLSLDLISSPDVVLNVVNGVPYKKIPQFFAAADLLLLTSLREGSPNVVKEAMAINIPVVSTNVGDVEWLYGNEQGYYVTSFDPNDVADKIKKAIEFKNRFGKTSGRNRLIELGLDSQSIAKRIIGLYEEVLSK